MLTVFAFTKILHIFSVLLFLTSTTVTLFPGAGGAGFKILAGLSSSILLLTGIALATAFTTLPLWVLGKLILWSLLAVLGPFFAGRLRGRPLASYSVMTALAFAAIAIAVIKPVLQ